MSSTTKTKFSPPPLAPLVPVPEYLLSAATTYPDRDLPSVDTNAQDHLFAGLAY